MSDGSSVVLIVEDDKHFAAQLKELVEFNGHEAHVAYTGPDGVSSFNTLKPDFVLMDVMLPNLHGIRVLEKLRAAPRGGDVPVLLMSAVYRSESIFEKDIKRLGALGFLAKPFSLMDLGRKIDGVLASEDKGRRTVRRLLIEAAASMTGPVQVVPEPGEAPAAPPKAIPGGGAESSPGSMTELPAAMKRPRDHTLDSGDSFVRVDTSRRLPAMGELTPAVYVQMLTTLFHSHSSGRFVFESREGRKTLFLLNGYPVWAEHRDPMRGLPAYLERTGTLTSAQLRRIGSDAVDASEVRKRLLIRGLMKASDLDEHLESWVADEVRLGLGHEGTFKFHRGDDFAGAIPVYEINPIRALWTALPDHLELEGLRRELDTLEGRSIGRTRTFNRLFGYVASTSALRSLGEALLQARRIEEVRSRFPDSSGQVTRCLWFMIHAGLVALSDSPAVERTGGPRKKPNRPRPTPQPRVATPPPQRVPEPEERVVEFSTTTNRHDKAMVDKLRAAVPKGAADHAALIVRDYVTRMEMNHYDFLGVPQDATMAQIDEAYTQLAPRYRIQNLDNDIQGDVRRKAKELLTRLVRVFDELSDGRRRTDYDVRLMREGGSSSGGRNVAASEADLDAAFADEDPAGISMVMAPVEEEAPAWWPGSEDPSLLSKRRSRLDREDGAKLVKAHTAMARSSWTEAAALIEELRQIHPSDSGLLADLGWCRFAIAPASVRGIDKAMDWADLALAFDPEHAEAIEVRARILSATDRTDESLRAVKKLLRVRKTSEWGKAKLAELSAPAEEPKGKGLGRFLGRRR